MLIRRTLRIDVSEGLGRRKNHAPAAQTTADKMISTTMNLVVPGLFSKTDPLVELTGQNLNKPAFLSRPH